jgi:predicted ATPase/class 3 adenylate cyclase
VEPLASDIDRPATTRHAVETSTFLFTDIEGSTRLWDEHVDDMGSALAQHDRLLRDAIEASGGAVIKTTGDGILAVFGDPVSAVDAAVAAQRGLRAATWGATGPLQVRMALHSGVAEVRDGDYFGPALNRASRILAIGHGGQIICSAVTAVLAGERLPPTIELIDLGSHRLRDIDRPERVYQVVVGDLPRAFPPLRSLSTRRSNMPVSLTSFVGRETELAEVATVLDRHRLVTVVGTGGTGKTRLMLEAAGRLLDRFPDGVWLAELAPLTDPSQIPSEVARALGAPEVPGVPATTTVTAFVADKELLLLLDNAEHLVDGTAAFAERLLAGAPGLRILATSREPLAVPGEAVLPLQSLTCPLAAARSLGFADAVDGDVDAAASTEAVRLFTDRAAAVDPAFTLGRSNVAAVGEICRRVDGIPLAIELAAARVSAMSPDEIATRLGDRFRLLTGGRRTAVPRQQTLHALIDWSWDLLTEEDRRLLRRLSVFTGGWTIPMAAQIVGDESAGIDSFDLIEGLTRLVDRSLVTVDRDTMRYRMLETIRQYAREKVVAAGEAPAVADRHLAAFAALAGESEAPMRGPNIVDWLDRLDAELDNLGSALEWGMEADPWTAVQMAVSLLPYWGVRVMSQDNDARIIAAIEFVRSTVIGRVDATPAEQALGARLLGEAARLWAMSGRATVAYGWAQDAGRLAQQSGDRSARLAALAGLGIATVFTGRSGASGLHFRALFEDASDLAEEVGEWWLLGLSASFAGASLWTFDAEAGAALLRRGVEAARRSRSPYAIGSASMAQGRVLGRQGDTDGAAAAFAVAIQRFTEIGDERFVLACRSDLAHALRRGGRLEEAMALYRETMTNWVRLGHKGAIANQLENVAYVLIAGEAYEPAVRLLAAADVIREAADARMAFDEEPEYNAAKDRLRDAMTASAFAAGWAEGQAMSQPDAVAVALTA